MRIGILASSGGSAFIEAWKILCKYSPTIHDYFVITDRECGIEIFCHSNDISCKRIKYINREQFSIDTSEYIQSVGGADVIFLYFLRILTKDVFSKYLCLNIHPALLPAFRGGNAVEQFIQSGARFMGATLHMIDEGIDTGSIIAQVQVPVKPQTTLKQINKLSFLQKVYLTLVGIDLLELHCLNFNQEYLGFEWLRTLPCSHYANPLLQNQKLLLGFVELQKRENCQIM